MPLVEAQALIRSFCDRGVATRRQLPWSVNQPSSFYYKASGKRKGLPPSTSTVDRDGEIFDNEVVLGEIKETLQQEFCCYGYRNVTAELKEKRWVINHKKVYRIMKASSLLYRGRIRVTPFKRDFIRFRNPIPVRPMQYLSMEIKSVHIHIQQRNALLPKVMDIYARKVLIHTLRFNIRKGDALVLLSILLLQYLAEGICLRNDNGSHFIAQVVRQFLKEKGVYQEFSHVATPQDNAFIEALHSNLQRELIDRYEFESIFHAQMVIDRYYAWYKE